MMTSPAWPSSARSADTAGLEDAAGRVGPAHADRLAFATTVAGRTAPLAAGTAGAFFVTLAAIGAADVALARTVEPHLDALSILDAAGVAAPAGSAWGVFAAEAPGLALTVQEHEGGPVLSGTKPWCSLASSLSHALVTATVGDGRGLFAVDLRHPGVTTHDDRWVARGMPGVPSGPVDFDAVPATPVGDPGWYLTRPGFAWGGIGVAACWFGGAVGLARTLRTFAAARSDSDLVRLALGATVLDLEDAEDALAGAAARIDADPGLGDADPGPGDAPRPDWPLVAQTVRSRVRAAAARIRARVTATIGPAPLTADPDVAARVADLELYLLQDHGDRDVARIGRIVLERGGVAW
ncbi:acyl-CoA dehydrogenase [Curtobacterium sp. RRHDQ10]|uniref:acyl-CoA dehydrogenase n=1 Tax=Curtobacterium phyllosphaerae TaxID=3413379 RepID=UPI003BF0A8CD